MMLAMNYGPDQPARAFWSAQDRAAISVYAQNRDYHDVIKGKLKASPASVLPRAHGQPMSRSSSTPRP
jgi:epoxyqueuosine reductase